MIREAIISLSRGGELGYDQAEVVMNEILSGSATPAQAAAYLTAQALIGETLDMTTASAAGMRMHCAKLLHDMDVLELVSTGGRPNAYSSTPAAALVAVAGGVPSVCHSHQAAGTPCNTADMLEALGVSIAAPPEGYDQRLGEQGFCFLFAQNRDLVTERMDPLRKELGIRTVLDLLEPLTIPDGASVQLLGVSQEMLVRPLAQVLSSLGVFRGMVVCGQDGRDEISMGAPTAVCELQGGRIQSYELTPEQFGYPRCRKSDLLGGDPQANAAVTRAILSGSEQGPKRQAVCLNAGAALYLGYKAESLADGVKLAESLIDSGAAAAKLEDLARRAGE